MRSNLAPEEFAGTGRFVLQRRLGAGASGVVYSVYDRERGGIVALKALRRSDPEALYRFKQEFRALVDLSHPNLISLYELLSEGEQWFFTMELIEGANFLEFVVRGPGLGASIESGFEVPTPSVSMVAGGGSRPTLADRRADAEAAPPAGLTLPGQRERLRSALGQLAEGLCALHEAGKLHRDIKPSNVLVSNEGRLVLLDFSLVRELGPRGVSESGGDMQVQGTPSYMSPEQALGLPLSEASDWCSVGVMLYVTLTGRLPYMSRSFDDGTELDRRTPTAPRELVPDVPEDLDALCLALLRRDPTARPSGREVLRRLGGRSVAAAAPAAVPSGTRDAPFVGRQRHLTELEAAFQASKGGRAVIVAVNGGSGMGKSALVHHFLGAVQRRERVVALEGRCYERESVPYKALDSLVDALSRYLKRLPAAEAEGLMPRDAPALARLFPVLRRVEAVAGARRRAFEVADLQEMRRRAFGALRELFARLTDRRPVVLFIDDVQWGDADSAALLAELLRPPEPPPFLLVACYRSQDAETSPFLRTLLPAVAADPAADVRPLGVEELTPEEARDLALGLIGEATPAARMHAEAVARESSGSPFLLGELVRYARGALTARDGSPEGALTLETVLRARLSRLRPDARLLLEVVAVAGQPIALETAKRAARLETGELEALRALTGGHLVRTRGPQHRVEIETYHDRIRDTVVAHLLAERLRALHRLLALELEASGEAEPETLAVHFEAGGDRERGAEYAAAAARQAVEALAFGHAARLYRRALELRPPDELAARALRVRLAEALANAGRGAEAAEAYLAATQGAPAAERLELQRRAAEQFLISGHFDQGLRTLRAVLASIGMKLPRTPRGALLSLMLRRGLIRFHGLRFRERDATQVPPEELIRIDTCWSVAAGLGVVDPIRGADFQSRHLLLALRAGEPYRIARALAIEVGYNATSGRRGRVRTERLARAATALAERINHPHAMALVSLTTGIAAFLIGEWQKAHVLCERAEQMLRERCTGVAWELDGAQIFALLSLFELGELSEIIRRLPALLKEGRDRGDLLSATSIRTRVAYLAALAADQPETARQEVVEAMRPWSQRGFHLQHYWELVALVETDLYAGDGGRAWKRMAEAWPVLAGSHLLRVQNTRVRSLYLRGRSALAAAAEEAAARPMLLAAERDARRMQRERVDWADALARLIRGGIAAAGGAIDGAAAHFASAEASLAAAHMALYAAAARRRRGELIGGDEGRALVESADAWMAGQQIRNPARMAAMLAPGARA